MHHYTRLSFACLAVLVGSILVFSGVISASMQAPQSTKVNTELEAETPTHPSQNVAANSKPIFAVSPQELTVKVNDTFVVHVSAANITDMYAWQVRLSFDATVLQCLDVSVTNNYVFLYARNNTAGRALVEYNSTEFTNPLYRISNSWVLAGDTLISNQPTFSGSGTLCQIKFKAISIGSSPLALSTDHPDSDTFFLNRNLDDTIPFTLDGRVHVSLP